MKTLYALNLMLLKVSEYVMFNFSVLLMIM